MSISRQHLGIAIMLGSVWGLSEAALGMGLHKCASVASGSIMTGVALFFIAAGWSAVRRVWPVLLVVAISGAMKLFDAFLLSLPVRDGAVANPIFAFVAEGAVFLVLALMWKGSAVRKRAGQAVLGGASALVAVGLFPLVKFVTGIPACVYAGTRIPLSWYFAPLAVAVSLFTVPLGYFAGEKLGSIAHEFDVSQRRRIIANLVSPATFVLCLIVVALIRLI